MEAIKQFNRAIIFLICIVLMPMFAQAGQGERQMAKAIEYFQEVAAFVVNEDARDIYQRMTPAVKSKLSEKDIALFLHKYLNGLGEPRGLSIIGFDVNPNKEFCQVKGLLSYEKEDLVLTSILKVKSDGFQIQYLHVDLPNSKSRIEQVAQEPKRFLKEKFFPVLQNQGVEGALALVDKKVRQQVGDDLIRAILRSLKKTSIKSIKSYNVDNGPQGRIHQFLLLGLHNGSPCEVEIYLKSENNEFTVVDVNLRLLKES